MNNYQQLYWLTRLDGLKGLSVAITVISVAAVFIWIFFRYVIIYENDEYLKALDKKAKWPLRLAYSLIVVFALAQVLIPTKNEMILIYAGGKTMDYVQSDTSLSKIPYQATALISTKLDEYLKEAKK